MTEEVRFILSADDSKATAALKRTEDGVKRVGTATAYTKQQMQQLSFQMTDIVSGLATGQSPFYVLMQQGGQLRDTFGGLGGAVRAVSSVFTLARVAAGGFAAGLGTVASAAIAGWQESNRLRDAITLTGNAAGMTQGRFNSLAESIAASTTATIGDAREMALALAETGRIGAPAMDAASRAAVAMQKATGASVESIVKDFARASSGVAKWAQEANQRFHFLTVEEFKLIAAMEKHGKTNEALAITFDALARPFKAHEENLGSLERFWRSLTQKVSEYQDAVLSIGRTKTLQDELAEVEKGIANLSQPQYRGTIRPGRDAALENLRERRSTILESLRLQGRAADAAATNAAAQERAIASAAGTPARRGLQPWRSADPSIGPPTFDDQYPFPSIAEILRGQRDNGGGTNQEFRRMEIAGYGETDGFLQRQQEEAVERNRWMVEQMTPEWKKLAAHWDDTTTAMGFASKNFTDGFVDAGRDAFQEFMRTGQLSADGFKNLFIQTITELIYDRVLAKQMGMLGDMLWNYVAQGMSGGGWGGGGGGSGITSGNTGLVDYGLGGGRASGGSVMPGQTYLVGERGPELLRMGNQSGWVVPNHAMGGGGASVVIHQHITAGSDLTRGELMTAMRIAKDAAVAEIQKKIDRGNRMFGG
jgi:phage-related minor tail protein